MKLMTKSIEREIPKFYEGSGVAFVKYFLPWTKWKWYGCEYDVASKTFYGYVEGTENEWGYFSLTELEHLVGPYGCKVERDMYFAPQKVGVKNVGVC